MIRLSERAIHSSSTFDPRPSEPDRVPPARATTSEAFLYMADCPSLRIWSRTVGFTVMHVSVTSDPLSRIFALRRSAHAQSVYASNLVRPDVGAEGGDWTLRGIERSQSNRPLPQGCSYLDGTIRVTLPDGASPSDLCARLAIFLHPLDAVTCSQLPSAVLTRAMRLRPLFVTPRYSSHDGAPRLARDLYRIDDEDDADYVLDALDAAITALGRDCDAFDRLLATLGRCPRAREQLCASVLEWML